MFGSNSSQDNYASHCHRPALPPPPPSGIFVNTYQQDGGQAHASGNTHANKLPPISLLSEPPPAVTNTTAEQPTNVTTPLRPHPSRPKYKVTTSKTAWTVEEDNLLRLAVQLYGDRSEKWTKIAACVPDRTNKMCRKRWFHSLDPNLRKGPWTLEEDELLRKAVEKHKRVWCKVAESIPGRTDDQCAKRWKECLDPDIDHTEWTEQEDALLLQKHSELGSQWQQIAQFFPGRPGLHCRNRFRKIQRLRKANKDHQLDMIIITPDDISPTASPTSPSDMPLSSNSNTHIPMHAQNSVSSMQANPQSHFMLSMQPPIHEHLSSNMVANHTSRVSQNSSSILESNLSPEPIPSMISQTTSSGPSIASLLSSSPNVNIPNIETQKNQTNANTTEQVLQHPVSNETEHDSCNKAYGCGVMGCEINFASSNGLYYHVKAAHPNVSSSDKPYRCALPDCYKSYKNINGLQYHIANAKGSSGHQCDNNEEGTSEVSSKPYKCPAPGCKNSYRTPNGLQYHQKKHHGSQLMAPSSNQQFESGPSSVGMPDVMEENANPNNPNIQPWATSNQFVSASVTNPPTFNVADPISVTNLLGIPESQF
ncbi:15190_t:CDS:2 [Acaulospora morrowiae]|uniref:15190_t:CDS:1 n=1 Tax=Acaulospora morrowiae TaxID=94023 RepID=A0A9N9FKU6_9GLOM|nr:15190_t:CDS:2 [Acaulospora morrowiae]